MQTIIKYKNISKPLLPKEAKKLKIDVWYSDPSNEIKKLREYTKRHK